MDIQQIVVLDFYGGPHFVSVKDYYNSNDDNMEQTEMIDNDFDNLSFEDNHIDSQKTGTNYILTSRNGKSDGHIKIKIDKRKEEIEIEI